MLKKEITLPFMFVKFTHKDLFEEIESRFGEPMPFNYTGMEPNPYKWGGKYINTKPLTPFSDGTYLTKLWFIIETDEEDQFLTKLALKHG